MKILIQVIYFFILFINLRSQMLNSGLMHRNLNNYYNFYNGAVGDMGYWGGKPNEKPNNVFNSKWNKDGYEGMYNLNSNSPFLHDRTGDFDTMTPYYTPFGASRYSYIPTNSNYKSNNELSSFAYDVNEPRYSDLYKDYYRFFNTNLDRLTNQLKHINKGSDLNADYKRRIKNPNSFNY